MKWEPSEDQFLKDHYDNLGPDRCSKLLGRSYSSVTKRSHRLGILLKNPYLRDNCRGLSREEPTLLYLVSFVYNSKNVYKLGITNNTVERRYKEEFNALNMRIEWTVVYSTGLEAYRKEQQLLREFSEYLINTGALRTGNTETLSVYIKEPTIL